MVTFLQSRPSCPSDPGVWNAPCTSNPYAKAALFVYEGGVLRSLVANVNNNYQFTAITNTTGATQTYTIELYIGDWSGLSSSNFAVAWDAAVAD